MTNTVIILKQELKKLGSSFEIYHDCFKVFAKFLGILLILSGITVLFSSYWLVFLHWFWIVYRFPLAKFYWSRQFWLSCVVFWIVYFFAVGIRSFLTLLGFKYYPNMKSIGNIAVHLLLFGLLQFLLLSQLELNKLVHLVDGRDVKKRNH
jgi:hypothetical protein